jgi:hypothetical protein
MHDMHDRGLCHATVFRLAAWLALLAAIGCRSGLRSDVSAEPSAAVAADRPRAAPRTIPLELVFVRHEEHDPVLGDELWNLADEQVLPEPLRRRLHANGLRAGVVTAHLPPHLADRFLPSAAEPGDSLPSALPENPALVRHVLRLLPGRTSDVMAATDIAELVLLEHDGETLRGTTYHAASPLFALRSWPAADGRVRLKLAPTIKHGPVERSWVGEEGMFRLEAGQRRDPLEGIEFEASVPIGSMLIVGRAGEPASTAGDAFFRDRTGSRSGQRLLAIRPLPQPQNSDPMFAPPDAAAEDSGEQ